MKNKILLISIIIVLSVVLTADIPNGYYDNAEGLSGTQLRSALHNIIDNHNSVSYNSLWDYFEDTDRKPNGRVWDIYSDDPDGNPPYYYYFYNDQCGNYNSEGDCYNREHTWPSSWFNAQSPMKSDLFHIYPTDGYVNGMHSNYPLGEVSNPTWTSMIGYKKGDCSYPGYSDTVFEPIDEYKGDFARTYFYMSTRYYTEDGDWDSNGMVDGADLRSWAVNMLAEWHLADPVSEKELDRNDAVYQIQNNRNPFIDHPEYVDLIWGDSDAESDMVQITKPSLDIYPNPFNPKTNISFMITGNEGTIKTSVTIYNLKGEKVKEIFSGYTIPNKNYTLVWNGKDKNSKTVSSGSYIVLLKSGKKIASKSVILLK